MRGKERVQGRQMRARPGILVRLSGRLGLRAARRWRRLHGHPLLRPQRISIPVPHQPSLCGDLRQGGVRPVQARQLRPRDRQVRGGQRQGGPPLRRRRVLYCQRFLQRRQLHGWHLCLQVQQKRRLRGSRGRRPLQRRLVLRRADRQVLHQPTECDHLPGRRRHLVHEEHMQPKHWTLCAHTPEERRPM